MGYITKKIKRKRHSRMYNTATKLVLLGAKGSHMPAWPGAFPRPKQYYIEMPDGTNIAGWSRGAVVHLMAKHLEIE